MNKFERYKRQVEREKQNEIDDLMTWHKIDKQRIAKLKERIKELQAQLALKNHPVLLWQENKKLQEQVDELKIDFICANSYGNSYFMQLKAAEGKVKELQAKLDACTGDYRCCNYLEQKT